MSDLRLSWQERALLASNNEEVEKHFRAYHINSADSVIHFINTWVLTYDPRLKKNKTLPFELFPKQEEYIRFLWERYKTDTSGVTDKCRTAGASWCIMAFFVYMLLFVKDCSLQVYTFKAEACHKLGDISSLMQKAIFILDNLPKMFTDGVKSNFMYIHNSRNNSDIAGSSGDNPGRSSRRTIVARDEEAFYENAESIEAALSETSNCHISVSTHKSTNTLFYRKCTSGMPTFVFNWFDDPRNTQEWYDKKRQDAEDKGLLHIFEREINRNAAASVDAVCVPSSWVSAARRNDIKLTGRKIAGLDPANEGGDTHGFCVVDGNCFIYADESGEGDPGDATDKYFWKAHELGCDEFRYEPNGIGVGVSQRIKEILNNPDLPVDHPIRKMTVVAWNPGGAVMRPKESDYAEKENQEFFENAKAQAWFKVRTEFLNTYRAVNGKDHEEDQLISFPEEMTRKMEKLILELSQPQYVLSKRGKTMIDKKPKGTKSPNLADAYMFCRAEVEPEWSSWGVG